MLVPDSEKDLEDIGVELVQRFITNRCECSQVRKIIIVDVQQVDRGCDFCFLDKAPVIAIVIQKFVRCFQLEGVAL